MKNQYEKLRSKKVMILAGGTGGHIFPALTVAKALSQYGAEVFWLGTQKGLESKIVEGVFPIDYIQMKGLRKKGFLRTLSMPFVLLASILASYRIIKKRKIDLVIGFGGYVAAPGGIAAKLSFKPLIIHEQNARSGLANRMLSKIANEVLSAFEAPQLPQKTKIIGNPLRKEILNLHRQEKNIARSGSFNILVTGGSLGAHRLNQIMPNALSELANQYPLNIYHQTGINDLQITQQAYANNNLNANVSSFIDQVEKAYDWADIIICRAGALTVSEVAVTGVPAIFIPYPYAVDDHQYHNAQWLVQADAAFCIRQKDLTADKITTILSQWLASPNKLQNMSSRAKDKAKTHAVEHMIEVCSDMFSPK